MASQKTTPLSFTVRPINRGLSKSKPPQEIDPRESADLFDVRFAKGLVQFRNGFKKKYTGPAESMLWLDLVYSVTESQVIGLGPYGVYGLNGDNFELIDIYDSTGAVISYPYFNLDPQIQYLSVDAGFGQYQFAGANSGALFPGADSYETLTVFCNGTTDGIFVLAYTTSGAEGEQMGGGICPSLGRSIAIWDGRVFVGGDENDNAKITWSSKGLLSDWTIASGAGSLVLGDSPDWIQAMRKLGEYLIVYKERSIFIGRRTFLVDPPVRFDPAPGQGIGCAAPNSIGDLGEEHIFLGWDNIYIFSLQKIEAVGSQVKDEIFYGEHGILPKYLGNCTGIIAEEFDEYWLFVPTGKWPTNGEGGDGEDTGVSNILSDPLCTNNDSDWVYSGTGSLTDASGIIGANALQAEGPDGLLTNTVGVPSTAGLYSLTVWVKGASIGANTTITVSQDSTMVDSLSFETTDTDYHRYVLSVELDAVGSVDISIECSDTFTLDACHLVFIDSVSEEFLIDVDGYYTVGYLDVYNTPQEIPLIVDSIGPWLPDTCWVFNYETNAWSCWRIPITGFGYDSIQTITSIADLTGTIAEQTWRFDEKRIVDFAPTNLLAQPDGQIYEVASEYFKDFGGILDRTFIGYWQSKDFDLGRPEIEKTFTRITLYHETSHAPIDVAIGYSTDSGLTWEEQTIAIAQGRFETHIDMFITGPQVRLRIQATSPGFFIHGFSVKVIPRGETNVY